jgi:predicted nucleic acid-binding protein
MVRVIDTSVAIKWFVEEKGREAALGVLAEAMDAPEGFAVPELFFFELAHVFNRLFPSPTEEQCALLENVMDFGIARFNMTGELIRGIRRFQRLGLSGYDAAYVALAEQLGGQWITFDTRAYQAIRKTGLSVLLV